MITRTTPRMDIVRQHCRLSISDIAAEAAARSSSIEEKIAASGLEPSGPWIFVSHNLPQDAETLFDWEIWRPVAGLPNEATAMEVEHIPSARVASRLFRGILAEIFTCGYLPLLTEIAGEGLALSGESREIYHQWSGPEEQAEVEIQFVLA